MNPTKEKAMPRRREIPEGAEVIRTYAMLQWFMKAFTEGLLKLLIVVGRPGLSKSAAIKEILKEMSFCYIQGHTTPIQLYMQLFENKNQPVILDDVEGLTENPAGRNLLSNLTQTDDVKRLQWLSSSRILIERGVPMQFATTSRVCLITNRWSGTSKEIQALEDRGHLIYFDPTPDEVHQYVGTWLQESGQDVYDYIGANLHLIDRPSCRLYEKALDRKAAGGDWQEYVLHHCHQTAIHVVQRLLEDPSCRTENERVQRAKEEVGISKATFYRYKRELEETGQIRMVRPYKLKKITLTSSPPPTISLDAIEEENGVAAALSADSPTV
jgi:hypothetical protein